MQIAEDNPRQAINGNPVYIIRMASRKYYYCQWDEDGRRRTVSTRSVTREQAERFVERLAEKANGHPRRKATDCQRSKRQRQGVADTPCIYFIADGDAVKIGFAAKPYFRLASIQSGNPRRLLFIGAVPGTREDESGIHKRLDEYRILNEWFKADIAIAEYERLLADRGEQQVHVPKTIPRGNRSKCSTI